MAGKYRRRPLDPFTDTFSYKHPYAHEIEYLQYPQSLYQPAPPIKFSPPENSQAVYVDTEEAVHQMLQELKSAKEIAIDLEHNDKNSYVGLVCLMQISTRNKDWIVDTLKPWRENLQILNEVFADPKIVKVLHGSSSDIIWLQRDLGLYIVGLFDTFYASNALRFPAKSLKYLLQRFANFEAQKQFQLSDWRVRPLPKDLLDYARSDTHYLLYIFDCLKVMLKEASTPNENLMDGVLESSKRESLQVYERHNYDEENGLGPAGWLRLLMSRSTGFSNEQFGVFRALHGWRDRKARELDEGEQYIMPNLYLFTYAEHMPTRRQAFFQRGLPGRLPQSIIDHIPEICEVVKEGRDKGKDGPSIYEAIAKNGDKVTFFGRNKFPKKKSEDVNRGIGATVQLLNGTGELSTTPSVAADDSPADVTVAVRSTASQLFGNINFVQFETRTQPLIAMQALRAVFPFDQSQLIQSSTKDISKLDATPPVPVQPNPITNGTSQTRGLADNIFTASQQSKKRKAEAALEYDATSQGAVVNDNDQLHTISQKASEVALDPTEQARRDAKKLKKAEKRAKQAAQAAELKAAQESIVPFDYANAESMLNVKPESRENGVQGHGKAKAKPLNPFTKSLDTGTGAKRNRMGKELAGKSHTFTS
jgi:exosome complex exonuclease RRP6